MRLLDVSSSLPFVDALKESPSDSSARISAVIRPKIIGFDPIIKKASFPLAKEGAVAHDFDPFSKGVLAQLVRALPCHGRGCGFEPRTLR